MDPSCSVVDWCRFREVLIEAATPIGIAALIALIGIFVRWGLYKLQTDRLHKLALLRRKGVVLRNDGLHKDLGPAFDEWASKVSRWKTDLFDAATRYSPVEAERLDTLDWMTPLEFPGVTDARQILLLRDMSETLQRLEKLIEERLRPRFEP